MKKAKKTTKKNKQINLPNNGAEVKDAVEETVTNATSGGEESMQEGVAVNAGELVDINSKKRGSKSRVWHIVKVITKYNAVLRLNPDKLRLMLEELGPTYVKLGQLMSTRPDILPLEYCQALEGLRSSVKPMPFETVRAIIEREFGKKLEDVFAEFNQTPIGSASIAQAHTATLLNGQKVVIKVQREHIYEIMQKDIKMLKKASKLLKLSKKLGSIVDYAGLLDEMWRVAKDELDFVTEASNMNRLRKNNEDVKYIKVPYVYDDLVTDKVLVMEYIDGCGVDDLDCLKENEYDLSEIAYKLCENYVKQVIDDGFYHADPHPGNIKISSGKIVWLDMGMMGELGEYERTLFKTAINAVVNADSATLKDICLTLGEVYGEVDHVKLNQEISIFLSKYAQMDLKTMQIGNIFNDFVAIASGNNITVPRSLTMFGRGLVSIEGVIETLDPNLSLMTVIKNYFQTQLTDKSYLESVAKTLSKQALGAVKKSIETPSLVNEYFKQWSRGESKLNVDLNISGRSMQGISRFVNKIAICIIMSFLVLGGSMCTLAPNLKCFWNLPIVSWVMFIFAFGLGVYLITPKIIAFFKRFR